MEAACGIAIVTGGAGSIGAEICSRLCSQGFRICIADIDGHRAQNLAKALGPEHLWFGGDLCDETVVRQLIAQTSAEGTISLIVNAAGVSPKGAEGKKNFKDISAAEFRRVFDVNTLAPFLVVKHAYAHMPHDGTASVINILSIAGRMATGGPGDAAFPPYIPSAAHYGASKAALHNLQTGLCRELAPYRIRVNGVAPGFIASDMTNVIPDDVRNRVVSQIPLGRAGEPADVAGVVEYLAGPHASYVTGAVVDVNGGWLPA